MDGRVGQGASTPARTAAGRSGLPRRPALDGLRGVAVLIVLLHHARVPGFTGGFVGVDVFFVLSGFLVTSLLTAELAATGRIALGTFWARRARRLLPALLAVLPVVAAYGMWLAPVTTRERLLADGASTVTHVANWWYLSAGSDYFGTYGDPSPLLHTWSLSVEEQFYLVCPLVLLAAAGVVRVARRLDAPHRALRALALLRWVLPASALIAGALWSVALARGGAVDRVHLGTDTRAQQLLAGVLLALLAGRHGWWRVPTAASRAPAAPSAALSGAGVAALAGLLVVTASVEDPGAWTGGGGLTAAAALAVVLVAVAAHPAPSVVRTVLAWRPLVLVGVVSYGLYLWHWPVFVVLDPGVTGLTGGPLAVARLAVTAAVATASYVLLERPARRADLTRLDPAVRRMLLPAAAAAGLACVAVATAGTPARDAAVVPAGPAGPAGPGADVPATRTATSAVPPTASGPGGPPAPTRVFVLGDSAAWNLHAQHPPRPGSGLLVEGSTQLGCDLLEGALVVDGRVQPVAEQCAAWPDSWRLQVGRQRPDVAVLVTGNGMLFDRRVDGRRVEFGSPSYRDVLRGFLDRTLRDLARTSTRVAVTTLPCFGKPDTGLDGTAAVVNDVRRQERFGELLRAELARHPRVALLDLRGHVCPGGAYREDLGGERLRTDGVHWSAGGARVVWRWLAPRLAAPQARPRQDAGRFRNGPSPRDAGPAPVRATPPSAPSPRTAGRTPEERSG